MSGYVASPKRGSRLLQSLLAQTLWRMPFPFQIAKVAGPPYTVRGLLFHDIADETSVFTQGLNVTLGCKDFESKIEFIAKHYSPIGLRDFIEASCHNALPPRPALVTFDDAYASVALNAAPVLQRYKIPAVFFVISSLVGNQDLGLDNLVCYVANTSGMKVIESAVLEACGARELPCETLEQIFDHLLPAMSPRVTRSFRQTLTTLAGLRPRDLARHAELYVSAEQLRALASNGFEIGNHTLSHCFCRSLTGSELTEEIGRCKSQLESITGKSVRSFSVPYGSPLDLTQGVARCLRDTGHEAIFLARSRSNTPATSLSCLNRIDLHAGTDGDTFAEIEILPRLRSLADILSGKNRVLRIARAGERELSRRG